VSSEVSEQEKVMTDESKASARYVTDLKRDLAAARAALVEYNRDHYLRLRPGTARILSAASLLALAVGLILKLVPSADSAAAGSLLSVLGMVGVCVMFVCTYGFIANAPDTQIDERELQVRNAAYFRSYQYGVFAIFFVLIGSEIAEKMFDVQLSALQLRELLSALFFSALIMPATILAWHDSSSEEH